MKGFTGIKKWLNEHFGQPGIAFYAFWGCTALIALTGLLLRRPSLFPSLGPAAILFFERDQRPPAPLH